MNEQTKSLIRAYTDGVITPDQLETLEQRLKADDSTREQFLQEVNLQAALEDVAIGEGESRSPLREPTVWAAPRREKFASWPLAMATAAAIALIAGVYLLQPHGPQTIAKITGLNGTFQWTGDGGRVFHDLTVGTELPGGTIDGMSPDSWFELQFNDGSTVMISGNSMLTFSDLGQKTLHLKGGSFSANVLPQPQDKPMLIHTRSAVLEVLGTRFDVEARIASTFLNVSEGKVRVKRLSDGKKVDVPAKHRVIAAADRELSLERVPDSVDQWKSQLRRGPRRTYGQWLPETAGQDARLKAIPHTTEVGKTIYTASLSVSSGDNPPVVLQPESSIRVRGQMATNRKMYFGMTLRHANGDFAGRFQTTVAADQFQSGQEFDVVLSLENYQLDPSLAYMQSKLPSLPTDLIVESVWCHTLYSPAGLEITEVELIAPKALEAN